MPVVKRKPLLDTSAPCLYYVYTREVNCMQLTLEQLENIILTSGFRHRSLKERAAEYDGKLNLSDEIDWGEPTGSEVW